MDKLQLPLVSIVFTSYNHKAFLKQALDSLVNQTYINLEIIIVDDCSSDGSQEILLQYEQYKNVILKLQTKNSGSYVNASNFGASFANGEYILFAQCDDFAELNQIETLLNIALNNPSVGVVFSKSNLVDENGIVFANDFAGRERSFKNAIKNNGLIERALMKEFLSFSCVIPNLSAALIKAELFKQVKGLSNNYLVLADWAFWLDLTEKTNFYYVEKPLNYFRQHGTTIRSSIKMTTQISEVYKMFYGHIATYNLSSSQIKNIKIGAGAVWFSYFVENKKAWFKCFTTVLPKLRALENSVLYYLLLGTKKQLVEYFYNKISKN